jgi:hypothetical protein
MTGRPSRVALWVTVLSGVIGMPARGCDGTCVLFGSDGAAGSAFGFLTCPCRLARAVIRIDGSAFGFVVAWPWVGSVCADVDATAPNSVGASANVASIRR